MIDVNTLQAGMVLRHRDGGKEDGSGWWNTDGSGFCWAALESGDWTVAPSRQSHTTATP